jgi:hypothetical protein
MVKKGIIRLDKAPNGRYGSKHLDKAPEGSK